LWKAIASPGALLRRCVAVLLQFLLDADDPLSLGKILSGADLLERAPARAATAARDVATGGRAMAGAHWRGILWPSLQLRPVVGVGQSLSGGACRTGRDRRHRPGPYTS